MKKILLVPLFCLVTIGCNSGRTAHNEDSSIEEPTFNETYDTMEEAEEKLIAALSSHYSDEDSYSSYRMPNYELIDFILNEPKTLTYDFPKLRKTDYVNDIVTSDDGNLRFYYWDTGFGGTMIDWGDICQYLSGDTVYALQGNILDVEVMNGSKDSDGGLDVGCAVMGISTIITKQNTKIYLVKVYIRVSSG